MIVCFSIEFQQSGAKVVDIPTLHGYGVLRNKLGHIHQTNFSEFQSVFGQKSFFSNFCETETRNPEKTKEL